MSKYSKLAEFVIQRCGRREQCERDSAQLRGMTAERNTLRRELDLARIKNEVLRQAVALAHENLLAAGYKEDGPTLTKLSAVVGGE